MWEWGFFIMGDLTTSESGQFPKDPKELNDFLAKNYKPLKPYEYPVFFRLFALAVVLLFLHSLTFVPLYYGAYKDYQSGKDYLTKGDYDSAKAAFDRVLEEVPSSKDAQKGIDIASKGVSSKKGVK
jgi:TolA-binding protein